jgi:hypothetical protein
MVGAWHPSFQLAHRLKKHVMPSTHTHRFATCNAAHTVTVRIATIHTATVFPTTLIDTQHL